MLTMETQCTKALPLSTLLAESATKLSSDERPAFHSVSFDQFHHFVVLLRTAQDTRQEHRILVSCETTTRSSAQHLFRPRAFDKPRFQHFLPPVQALYIRPANEIRRDLLPVLAVMHFHRNPQHFILNPPRTATTSPSHHRKPHTSAPQMTP